MKFGVAVFPGTWSDRDCAHWVRLAGHEALMLWHKDSDLQGVDCLILPGGFSYGDHLRCGAIARFSPLMNAAINFANSGGLVWGICNGFQILCEAHLLPGALVRNNSLQFRCCPSWLKVESSNTAFTSGLQRDQLLQIPVSHGEGRFVADEQTLSQLESDGQVAFRYVKADGSSVGKESPNGSMQDIAGITNVKGNVLGMMPHPERACEPILGSVDGMTMLQSLITATDKQGSFAAAL